MLFVTGAACCCCHARAADCARTLAVLDQEPVAKHVLKQAMSFGLFHLQQSCEGPHPLLSIQQRIAPAYTHR